VSEAASPLNATGRDLLDTLVLAAEYRDDATYEHADRIGRTAELLARALCRSDAECALLRLAAQLHDVGNIGIPDDVLLKRGRLTGPEFEMVKTHTVVGWELLSTGRSRLLETAAEIAFSHHERWDGSGYPSGLAGEDIPLTGRITAVADVFDALTHARPYKRAWPVEEAVEEIARQSGAQFDPEVAAAFASLDHEALLGPVGLDEAALMAAWKHCAESAP
jgi:HD-GYP domain-containing protein (c-di-GMP phosphodiesterase class II)